MDVTWRIEPRESGCRVSIDHDFRPGFGPWGSVIERLFVRPIAGRTLATFKAIAEAVADTEQESISQSTRDVFEIEAMELPRIDPR